MTRRGTSAKRPVAGPSRTVARGASSSPLRRKHHEAFVQSYLTHFNGYRAARTAGYSVRMAQKIWPVILQRRDVQARLTLLRIPPPDDREQLKADLLRHLWALTKGKGHLLLQHPITGEIGLDWARATPEDLDTLEICSMTTTVRNGRRRTQLCFRSVRKIAVLDMLYEILTATNARLPKRHGLFSGPKRVFTKEEVDFPPSRLSGNV
ncbi:terminase small subunit [Phaeovulum sp. NW3]|uniref:terminase small subunit n=1 Tax=Phaeovulum sp. NW3 TaxID=2934933 RepID=UPI002021E0EB|nr:terminase small subunit [Phaeovulum sp. NW3]MCL7466796.1 terminase small subunit [Phaeovulum sp. NW3]